MSISKYNGGCVAAMVGKNCVGIACDKRFGERFCTVDMNFSKIFEICPNIYVGISGLATDIITFVKRLKFRKNMFELRENRKVTPEILNSMISNMLYEKRFSPYYIEPIVAGLDEKGNPLIFTSDLIGCSEETIFCGGGAGQKEIFGNCEAFWEPDLEADALFEVLSQSLVNALEKNASSGYGGLVYIIEKDKVTMSELKVRMD